MLSNLHLGAAARLFKEFAKGQDKFEIKAAAFEGKFLAANQIDVLATLPTYSEAISPADERDSRALPANWLVRWRLFATRKKQRPPGR